MRRLSTPAPEAADILEALEKDHGGSLIATQETGIEFDVYLDRDRSVVQRVIRAPRILGCGGGWKTRLLRRESVFGNGLADAELERLSFLSKRCAEVIQVVAKIVRHGWESRDPTNGPSPSNRQMLETELGDIRIAIALLADAGNVSAENIAVPSIGRATEPG